MGVANLSANHRCEQASISTGTRNNGAYLAAHHSRITRRACVMTVRDGLRETGQVSSRIGPVCVYQSGYRPICSAPATHPDVDKC